MQLLHRWLPDRELMFVADSRDAVITLLRQVCVLRGVSLITRLRLDAQLDEPAPPRQPTQNGRLRVAGARRPTLDQVRHDPATPWTPRKVRQWYSGQEREVGVWADRAMW